MQEMEVHSFLEVVKEGDSQALVQSGLFLPGNRNHIFLNFREFEEFFKNSSDFIQEELSSYVVIRPEEDYNIVLAAQHVGAVDAQTAHRQRQEEGLIIALGGREKLEEAREAVRLIDRPTVSLRSYQEIYTPEDCGKMLTFNGKEGLSASGLDTFSKNNLVVGLNFLEVYSGRKRIIAPMPSPALEATAKYLSSKIAKEMK